jgi:hypothetical protein
MSKVLDTKFNALRSDIDAIVAEIEGEEFEA